MGNEGGFIPKRIELVKTVQAEKKADKDDALKAKWLHCSLSKDFLKIPAVVDQLGNLYNKEAVIQYLLEKKPRKGFEHLKKMKDVIDIKLTPSQKPEHQSKLGSVADHYEGDQSRFICPVTSVPMNGRHKFFVIKSCGCVLSEKALKEVPTSNCLVCQSEFKMEDTFPIYGDEAEVKKLREKLEEKLQQEKSEKEGKDDQKKSKKRKAAETEKVAQESKRSHLEGKSEVYKSLFGPANGEERPKKSNLFMGTFNFYAGGGQQ